MDVGWLIGVLKGRETERERERQRETERKKKITCCLRVQFGPRVADSYRCEAHRRVPWHPGDDLGVVESYKEEDSNAGEWSARYVYVWLHIHVNQKCPAVLIP